MKKSSLRIMRALCTILYLLFFLLVPYAAVDNHHLYGFPHTHFLRWTAAIMALVAIAAAAGMTFKIHREINPDDSPGSPKMTIEDPVDFVDKIRMVEERYGSEILGVFESVLTNPELYIARAVEDASVQENTLQLDVRITFDLYRAREREKVQQSSGPTNTSANDETFIIPFMRMKKGALLDNLDITAADGSTIATLSQAETRALTAHVVTILYWRAYIDPDSPCSVADIKGTDAQIWSLLLRVVLATESLSETLLASLEVLLDEPSARNKLSRTALLKLIHFLASHYVIAAATAITADDRAIIAYRKSLPCYAQYDQFRDKLRLLAGLRPYRFTVPLWLPYFAASYHFRMQGISGQYVMSHGLIRPNAGAVVRQEDFKELKPRPYIRIRHKRGLSYAHLYMRDFRSAKPTDLATVVRFAETPPGTLGGTTIVAWATAALAVVFTFLSIGSGVQTGSDIPALLLAAPAFAASFLGYTTDSESLLRTSLTARLSLIASGVFSFCSAVLYILRANHHLVARWDLSLLGGALHDKEVCPYWLGLSLASTSLALYLTGITFARTRTYMKAIGKLRNVENLYGLD